jgi:hypothetical protein
VPSRTLTPPPPAPAPAPAPVDGLPEVDPLDDEPPDAAAPPEAGGVVAVVPVPVDGVFVEGLLAADPPGTVSAGAGLLLAEVEPSPPPQPASPAASARQGATTASPRRLTSPRGSFMAG